MKYMNLPEENGKEVRIIKSILIAFSMYSRIPVPQFRWEEEEYSHAISFLPLIGIVIGAAEIGVWRLCCLFGVPVFVTALLLCLVPIVITGGFHLDTGLQITIVSNKGHLDVIRTYRKTFNGENTVKVTVK